MHASRRAFLLSAVALSACGEGGETAAPAPEVVEEDPRPLVYGLVGRPAAAFDFPKLGGGRAALSDYAGKVAILSFGGLWCPDCVLDGAYVARLSQLADADPDVDFLEIHTRNRFGRWGPNERARAGATPYDADESAAALNAYFAETGHRYPVAFDASRAWSSENYAIEWYPTYLIVDRAGVIRAWRTDLFDAATTDAFFAEARRIAAG